MILLVCLVLGLSPALGVLYLGWARGRKWRKLLSEIHVYFPEPKP